MTDQDKATSSSSEPIDERAALYTLIAEYEAQPSPAAFDVFLLKLKQWLKQDTNITLLND